ncbi:MAG: hypothetical protein LBO80_06465 [Treponema sp.]|jgi:hypothetical protein|nr:hypothetical protein [Treponema sp.]
MQPIQDAHIVRLIEQISEHYRMNIYNQYIRPALLQMPLDKATWDLIDILTEKVDQFRYQGFHLDELYRQIAACARFISMVRRDLVPGLRNRSSVPAVTGPNKVLRDMAVNNFASNLQVFADLINELYVKLVEMDKADARGHMPLYVQIPELRDVGRQLIGG